MDLLSPQVLTSAQLACLASPARSDVFTALRSLGASTVNELAAATGRPPASIHFHVKGLLAANLMRLVERRRTLRRPEAVYEITAAAYRLPDVRKHPESAPLVRRAVTAGLRQTIRGYELAAAEAANRPEADLNIQVIRAAVRLRPHDMDIFLSLLNQAAEMARSAEVPDGVRMNWSSVVYPDLR